LEFVLIFKCPESSFALGISAFFCQQLAASQQQQQQLAKDFHFYK